jgi:hypothetical protein
MTESNRGTYDISPKGAKASLRVCISISGLNRISIHHKGTYESHYTIEIFIIESNRGTYDISPKGAKASLRVCVSISGLRSPTKM